MSWPINFNSCVLKSALKNLPSCLELHIAAWYTTWDAAISFFENLKESFLSAVSRHSLSTGLFNSIFQLIIRHILVPKYTEKVELLKRKLLSLWEYCFEPFQGHRFTVRTEPSIVVEVGTLEPSGKGNENRKNWIFKSLINLKVSSWNQHFNLAHLCIKTFFTFSDLSWSDLYKSFYLRNVLGKSMINPQNKVHVFIPSWQIF